MVEITIADLRGLLEFGRAALDVRGADDLTALLRRLRHLVPADAVSAHEIGPRGITRWTEPAGRVDDGRLRLTASAGGGDSVVHVAVWRDDPPFDDRDQQLLDLALPFLTRGVAIVGHGPGTGPAVPPESDLTSREAQILSLVAEGATNKEAGARLGISPRTVQKHLEHIYGKLGTHRRTAAARWFSAHLPGDRTGPAGSPGSTA
jgi:DNA-binding CsgD family transcriptional regulator